MVENWRKTQAPLGRQYGRNDGRTNQPPRGDNMVEKCDGITKSPPRGDIMVEEKVEQQKPRSGEIMVEKCAGITASPFGATLWLNNFMVKFSS